MDYQILIQIVTIIFSGLALIVSIRANRIAKNIAKESSRRLIYDTYLSSIHQKLSEIVRNVFSGNQNLDVQRDRLSSLVVNARPNISGDILEYIYEFQEKLLHYSILQPIFDSNGNKKDMPMNEQQRKSSFEDLREARGWIMKQDPQVLDRVFIEYLEK